MFPFANLIGENIISLFNKISPFYKSQSQVILSVVLLGVLKHALLELIHLQNMSKRENIIIANFWDSVIKVLRFNNKIYTVD